MFTVQYLFFISIAIAAFAPRKLDSICRRRMAHVQSSSPDPLGLSDENMGRGSPSRVRRPNISPRKPLADASGNARRQDFYISTPPPKARHSINSKASSPQRESESPWRIRLTVQAERVDDAEHMGIGGNLYQAKTTTTTIPLKCGDDASLATKRGRGRPRKSNDGQKTKNGTPKPKAVKRKNIAEAEEFTPLDSWAPTPPRRRAYKSGNPSGVHKSPILNAPGLTTETSTPTRRSPERLVKARPFSRSRSRGRRQEITPRKLGQSVELEDETPSMKQADIHSPSGLGTTCPKQHSKKETETDDREDSHLASQGVRGSVSPCETSTQGAEDEHMWRNMIRRHSVSPAAELSRSSISDPADPTDCHRDFDTILESEGFSMVSVESLRSTSERLKEQSSMLPTPPSSDMHSSTRVSECRDPIPMDAAHQDDISRGGATESATNVSIAGQHVTQTPDMGLISPIEPEAPRPRPAHPETRQEHQRLNESCKYDRAVRAGEALQSVESPANRRSQEAEDRLASPFHEIKRPTSIPKNELTKVTTSIPPIRPMTQPSNTLFGGFSPATRRELKAGLRLGEELAKRNNDVSKQPAPGFVYRHESCHPDSSRSHPPGTASRPRLCAVRTPAISAGPSLYPTLDTSHLPSPARSTFDANEDQMSWRVESTHEIGHPLPPNEDAVSPDRQDSGIDYTMMTREAEWQREREAVSKQIQDANSSQVIVINSDDESEDLTTHGEFSGTNSSHESLPARGIDSFEDSQRPKLPDKPEGPTQRRRTIPSPWRREGEAAERSTVDPQDSDLFWQPDMADIKAAKRREERKQWREGSENTSQVSARRPPQRKSRPTNGPNANDISDLRGTLEHSNSKESVTGLNSQSFLANQSRLQPKEELMAEVGEIDSTVNSDLDSFEVNRSRIQPTNELEDDSRVYTIGNDDEEASDSEFDSYDANRDVLQPTAELFADEDVTVTLAEDVPPDVVPLPDSPSLGPVDPNLLEDVDDEPIRPKTQEVQKHSVATTSRVVQPKQASSSWFSALATPIWSLFSTGPPCPAATMEDILVSSPREDMPMMLPTCDVHIRALEPLVWASVLFNPDIFPFNPEALSNYVLGSTVHTRGDWSRTITKADCGILEAFLVLLGYRGVDPPPGRGLVDGERLTCKHIVGMIVGIWVQMVMEGHADVKDWKDVKTGRTRRGDRMWRKSDVVRLERDVKFVKAKREHFQQNGLPSWKERGFQGPFKLAKPL